MTKCFFVKFKEINSVQEADLLRNKNTAWKGGFYHGAGDKTWTYDLCITNALLYQLSYTGNIGQYILSQKQFQAPVSGFYKINCPRWELTENTWTKQL